MSENNTAEGEAASHHYADCDYCGRRRSTEWSVIVGPDGDVEQIECKDCGGTGWERGQEANHA